MTSLEGGGGKKVARKIMSRKHEAYHVYLFLFLFLLYCYTKMADLAGRESAFSVRTAVFN